MKTIKKKLFVLMIVLCVLNHANSYATKWIVNVQNFSFSPSNLPSVYVGDTVRWVWISGTHTTTNTSIPAGASTWDIPITISNQSYEYIPVVAGSYNYKCTPHEGMGMVGSFIVSPLPFISVNLKVFLEGPFKGTGMNTDLNISGLIPLNQPFNVSPWNYTGTENVPSIPNANIADWVLVELRETTGDASTATDDKQIHRQAAFVNSSGSIVGLDGSNSITFLGTITNNLYVIIWHRNHLAVMSSSALPGIAGIYSWDFTNGLNKAYLDGHKSIGAGMFGMISGDSDANGIIETADIDPAWYANAGNQGYASVDMNLDSQINNPDKDSYWLPNIGLTSNIPTPVSFTCGDQITDIDANIYNTILIGDQCWMKENLKTTTFKNGTPIPNVTDAVSWTTLTTSAFVWYNNDFSWKDLYGALYNWYTVVDTNGLCPTGWHVPSENDWTDLTDFIGGSGSAYGGRLKSCRQVLSPLGGNCNTSDHPRWNQHFINYGTDLHGFAGFPGGIRFSDGSFYYLGQFGYWWSSTESSVTNAMTRYLAFSNGFVNSYLSNKVEGFSVRCLRD